MESSSRKRKAAPTSSSSEGTGLKKLKLSNSAAANRTRSDRVEDVQASAAKLLEHLKRATDKTGRLIATEFLQLPDPKEVPEYYDLTKLPLAVDTIEEKLSNNEYSTLTALESDFKRLVQNAKDFNAPKSEIYEDSERVRKLVYNFMKVHNPAYKLNPEYHAVPTPIPEQDGTRPNTPQVTSQRPESRGTRRSTAPKTSEPPSERKPSVAQSSNADDAEGSAEPEAVATGSANHSGEVDFTGKTFQEAQETIVNTLLDYKDDEDGVEIYTPFAYLPSRKLEDYYQLIRHPVSLKSVAKRIQGVHGRATPTGITDFKTWDQFSDEISFIWRNAQNYNEDESDMYVLAGEFKEHFEELLAQAKERVELPSTKIKLGGPKPKVTLNLTSHRVSPTPGVSIDNEALARQRQMVQAGVNGQQRATPVPMTNGISPPVAATPNSVAGVTANHVSAQSATTTAVSMTNGMMPPPSMRPASGSPNSSQQQNGNYLTAPATLPPLPLRPYPLDDALLPSVNVATHPQLKVANPISIQIMPHASQAQQSATISVPASHYYIQIAPTISKQLSMGRPYKMFVTLNGTRLTQRDTVFHAETGKRTHVYEGSLAHGVNRIEVEVASSKKQQEGSDGKGLDVEKVTCFAHLMR